MTGVVLTCVCCPRNRSHCFLQVAVTINSASLGSSGNLQPFHLLMCLLLYINQCGNGQEVVNHMQTRSFLGGLQLSKSPIRHGFHFASKEQTGYFSCNSCATGSGGVPTESHVPSKWSEPQRGVSGISRYMAKCVLLSVLVWI